MFEVLRYVMINKYEAIKDINGKDFKRLIGIRRETFNKMLTVVVNHEEGRKQIIGRPQKLRYEDQIFMMLEYLREYRTYYHISVSYGISESNCYKIIKKIEDILIKSKVFSLPVRKELSNKDTGIKAILIDATETPIERPKKNRDCIIQAKRKGIR